MLHKLVDKNVISEMLATLEGMAVEENKIIRGSHNGRMLRLAARELNECYYDEKFIGNVASSELRSVQILLTDVPGDSVPEKVKAILEENRKLKAKKKTLSLR